MIHAKQQNSDPDNPRKTDRGLKNLGVDCLLPFLLSINSWPNVLGERFVNSLLSPLFPIRAAGKSHLAVINSPVPSPIP